MSNHIRKSGVKNMKIDPSTLKITDMRFADIDGAPKRCTLVKIYN